MFTIKRLNHMVLYIRDLERAKAFYCGVLGFNIVMERPGRAVFLRANGSDNHHDLGLFAIGEGVPGPTRGNQVGLYHGAWEVAEITDLLPIKDALIEAGALVGDNDHGTSLSLYAQDPDGNELEVFWAIPSEEWDTRKGGRLDLEGEIAKRTAAPA